MGAGAPAAPTPPVASGRRAAVSRKDHAPAACRYLLLTGRPDCRAADRSLTPARTQAADPWVEPSGWTAAPGPSAVVPTRSSAPGRLCGRTTQPGQKAVQSGNSTRRVDSTRRPGHEHTFVGGRIRLPRRRFRGRSRIPPGSPPTVNCITRCYPGGLQRDDIPVPEVLRAD